ncbi:MAG: hypothetical protein BGO29_07555 [Bacteroidales bacterium 36-12]|nr:MAG: hypothetical protein BGO29_07555 [Bacteroidales bacterium 36-12]
MKKILGLDLGTNSIGWALVEQNFDEKQGKILGMGSRIKTNPTEYAGLRKSSAYSLIVKSITKNCIFIMTTKIIKMFLQTK